MTTIENAPSVDLLDGQFYVGDPYSTYHWMREHSPLYWDATNELWGVFRYDDIVDIEKRKDTFVSSDTSKGGYRPNLPADSALIALDDPVHHKRRQLVSRRFTPRAINGWETHVRATVTELLDAAASHDEVDVIAELAAPLPARMIGRLLGFPEDRWPDLVSYSETTIALGGGPRYYSQAGVDAATAFAMDSVALYEEKQRCPADDLMTLWTGAAIDGEPLGLHEVAADSLLLLDGGAETTRTVIGRTLVNLCSRPDQWELLRSGADMAVATEEFIRFVTPIHNMCRVATSDQEVGGTTVRQGEQVVLMYGSANRDPLHFRDPERMDVTRSPNPHIAFGFGTHFCLGAALARIEIRVFFEELVRRCERVTLVPGSVVEMPNAFVYGLRSAKIKFE